MEKVKLIDIEIDKKTINDVIDVLKSGTIASGPKVLELEAKFSEYVGSKYAIAVNSGTSALHTALYACGIGPGDEVITTPFTFVATANSILMAGAKPVFVDVGDDMNIDVEKIINKVNNKTKAIIAVNLFGKPCNYEKLKEICKKNNLFLIEDAAQSVGSKYNNVSSGNLADISCFSFYATKNLMCGEGGIITTNNKNLCERSKQFRHHGQNQDKRYSYLDLGYNYRMTDIAATIALNQLEKIDEFNKIRNNNAKMYDEGLKNLNGIILPKTSGNEFHSYHQYTIRLGNEFYRDELKKYLNSRGIGTGLYYPISLNKFKHLKNPSDDFYNSEKFSKTVLSLPIQPKLKKKDISFVIDSIKEYLNEN